MSEFSVAALQSMYNGTFNGTKTGTITDDKNGAGTFSTLISHDNGVASYDETITYASGKTVEEKTTITQNADGTLQDVVQKFVNGVALKDITKTTSLDGNTLTKTADRLNADGTTKAATVETLTNNEDGTETIAGTHTNAKDKVSTISGTLTKTADGSTLTETITNAAGRTKTIEDQRSETDGTITNIRSGVGFNGVAFSDTTTKTLLDIQKSA